MTVGFASGDFVPAQKSSDGLTHWGGSGWARLGQYVEWLEHQEQDVAIGVLTWNRDHFCIRNTNDELIPIDILVMQRLMHDSLADHVHKARSIGQIIINDLDDWYWGLDPANDAFLSSHPKTNPRENRDHYKKVLASSNVVTVSTHYLADRIKSFVRCPIIVLENTVDIARFTPQIGRAHV